MEPGNYYTHGQGICGFKQLFLHFHRQRTFFVTRAKDNMKYEVVEEHPVDKEVQELLAIHYQADGTENLPMVSDTLRMVVYEDYATEMSIGSLTNDFTHSYLTIAELYRERWQVECSSNGSSNI